MKTRHPNVTVSPDRHGKLRARFRKTGFPPKLMKTLPDQEGFEKELAEILGAPRESELRHAHGSVNDLIARFYKSADFAAKGGDADKRRRRGLIESFRAICGEDMVADFNFQHIEALLIARSAKTVTPKGRIVGGEVAAMALRKQLRRLFAYAVRLEWLPSNPVEQADRVGKNKLAGFHPWNEGEIAQFKARHPLGTKARLALEIILWTGQRRGDARLFGPKHIIRGKINFRASKNSADLWLPVAGDLRAAIDAMPSVGLTTFLVTEYGEPFSAAGFGNWFADRCNEAGLPHCRAHGLRHAIGRRMAESEATQQGMKAVGGWKGDAEVATYSASANQEALAAVTINRVQDRFSDGGR